MAIEVRCPNGHRLKCPEDRAGKRGKCPKCGTAFQVPQLDGAAASQVTAASESGKRRLRDAAAEEKIEFRCPNGHKLSGPASLQGQPGQCPHCQAKFRIPRVEEEDERPVVEPVSDSGRIDFNLAGAPEAEPAEDDFLGIDELQEVEPGSRKSGSAVEVGFLPGESPAPEEAEPAEEAHPLASLFVALWQEHEHGGVVELHLGDGVIIVPDWWAPALSIHSHGVFAIQTADGSYVMETVAWDAIQRITIRQIQELPGGVFE
jgi:hypothetical protein